MTVFGRHEVGHLFLQRCLGFWGENPGFFHQEQAKRFRQYGRRRTAKRVYETARTGQNGSMSIPEPDPSSLARQARLVLVFSFGITIALFFVPFGRVIARPLLLFSTLVHELGHGIAAILVGGRFEALLIWNDGSGVATWTALVGRVGHAIIAAGGLVGPAIGAALCLGAGRRSSLSALFSD